MTARSLGVVFREEGRWRVELPGALACLSGLAFALGLVPPLRRRFPRLVWGSLVTAVASGAALWVAQRELGWEVAVDKWGVRLTSSAGEKIDAGIPASVRQGRDDTRLLPRLWVAIETDAGKVLLFESASGLFGSGFMDWPQAAAPQADERFSSLTFDLSAFRAALWSAMLR
jgi:hypothetical protein